MPSTLTRTEPEPFTRLRLRLAKVESCSGQLAVYSFASATALLLLIRLLLLGVGVLTSLVHFPFLWVHLLLDADQPSIFLIAAWPLSCVSPESSAALSAVR